MKNTNSTTASSNTVTYIPSTTTNTTTNYGSTPINDVLRYAIGVDHLYDWIYYTPTNNDFAKNYPPYNIIQADDDHYVIELAVTGFGQDDLSVSVKQGILTITGEKAEREKEPVYLHRGLSQKKFSREFRLLDYVEVVAARVVNGVMVIELERNLPDTLKRRDIAIEFVR